MFCRQCGASLDPTDIFCTHCATPVQAGTTAPQAAPPPPPPPRRSRSSLTAILAIAGGVLALGVVLLLVDLAWPRPDPMLAIQQLRQAYAQRDVPAFRRCVDEERLLGDAIDQMAGPLAAAYNSAIGGDSPISNPAAWLALQGIRPKAVEELRDIVEETVGGGAWSEQADDLSPGHAILLSLVHGVLGSEFSYESASVARRSGGSATVVVMVDAPSHSDPVPVTVDLSYDGGQWRVVRVKDILKTIASLGE
jgi:zinc-ribbon domain